MSSNTTLIEIKKFFVPRKPLPTTQKPVPTPRRPLLLPQKPLPSPNMAIIPSSAVSRDNLREQDVVVFQSPVTIDTSTQEQAIALPRFIVRDDSNTVIKLKTSHPPPPRSILSKFRRKPMLNSFPRNSKLRSVSTVSESRKLAAGLGYTLSPLALDTSGSTYEKAMLVVYKRHFFHVVRVDSLDVLWISHDLVTLSPVMDDAFRRQG